MSCRCSGIFSYKLKQIVRYEFYDGKARPSRYTKSFRRKRKVVVVESLKKCCSRNPIEFCEKRSNLVYEGKSKRITWIIMDVF